MKMAFAIIASDSNATYSLIGILMKPERRDFVRWLQPSKQPGRESHLTA